MEAVVIHEQNPPIDLKGAKVVDGFPSVGLVSTIVANYLIDMLGLEQIAVMDHPSFPTLSVVHNAEPLSPVRVYAGVHKRKNGQEEKLAVFVSEFQPPSPLMRPIGDAMLAWAKKHEIDYVISPEGLILEGEAGEDDEVEVFALGSTPRMTKLIKENDVEAFTEGIITGVCGILLNVGKRIGVDVVSILAEAHANYPDARSAAQVMEVIARFLDIQVDLEPLIRQAEGFEKQIKHLQKKAAAGPKGQAASPSMYG
jgi:uncharacterized protein